MGRLVRLPRRPIRQQFVLHHQLALTVDDPAPLEYAVRLVQAGERSAYREIVQSLLPRVRAFVVSRSLPGIDVDEVVQRTFVEAYQNIGDYRAGTRFDAWLITIARYQLMMETTRLRRRADYHTRYAPFAIANELDTDLGTQTGPDPRLEHLESCLRDLPEHGRQLIRLRYETDRPISDIAEELNRSVGAVRKHLHQLRRRLHDCINRKLSAEQAYE